MTTSSLRLDRAGTIQGDHQRLQAKLGWLHEELAAARLTAAQTDLELALAEAELEEHFTHEESGGFFAELLDRAPQLDERVSSLLQEHRELRVIFRSLRKTCGWACGESGTRSGWLAEFAEFHHRFDEHEQAEHDLMYEALQRDVGQGD